MRILIARDADHRALYLVFLDVRNGAARILENTSLADIIDDPDSPRHKSRKRYRTEKQDRREA
jgi:hypothetical protein